VCCAGLAVEQYDTSSDAIAGPSTTVHGLFDAVCGKRL
jgi:hypothetical protein